jgi:hypothetical protein
VKNIGYNKEYSCLYQEIIIPASVSGLFYTGMLLYLFKNVMEYSLFKRFFCTNVVGTNGFFSTKHFSCVAYFPAFIRLVGLRV